LDGSPQDLELLDQALDAVSAEPGLHSPMTGVGNDAGLFLGTVIIASIPGARWRLWPNGHPVVRLATGRDLDVVAMANDRVSKGSPLLADVYAGAAADDPRLPGATRSAAEARIVSDRLAIFTSAAPSSVRGLAMRDAREGSGA
jgi:hypothetical protein